MVHLALFTVQVLFASLAVAGKFAFREIPPFALVMLRTASGAAVFLVWHLGFSRERVTGRDLPQLALYGLLGVALNQLLFFHGLSYTSATNATVLGTTIPVFTIGVAVLLGRERPSPRRAAGIALALAGALYLVGAERFTMAARGNLFILANALSYACFLVLVRDILARYSARTVMAWSFLFGALAASTVGVPALVHTPLSTIDVRTWLVIVYIIIGPTLGSYILNTWALARAPSSTVAIYINLQPVMTGLMAWATLGERPPVRSYIATGLIFAGIYFATTTGWLRRFAWRPR